MKNRFSDEALAVMRAWVAMTERLIEAVLCQRDSLIGKLLVIKSEIDEEKRLRAEEQTTVPVPSAIMDAAPQNQNPPT